MHILKEIEKLNKEREDINRSIRENKLACQTDIYDYLHFVKSKNLNFTNSLQMEKCLWDERKVDVSFNHNNKEVFAVRFYVKDSSEKDFSISASSFNSERDQDLDLLIYLGKVCEFFKSNGKSIKQEIKKIVDIYQKKEEEALDLLLAKGNQLKNLNDTLVSVFMLKFEEQGTNLPLVYKNTFNKVVSKGQKTWTIEISYQDGRDTVNKRFYLGEVKRMIGRACNENKKAMMEEFEKYYEKMKVKEKLTSL